MSYVRLRLSCALLLLGLLGAPALQGQGLPPVPGEGGQGVLVFPAVIDFIYSGDFDVVPDDELFRAYIVSVMKGVDDACGGSGLDLAASIYGQPRIRQAVVAPGEALAEVGRDVLSMMESILRGDVGGFAAGVERFVQSGLLQEGVEDGDALADTYQCNSDTVRRLTRQFKRLVEAKPRAPSDELDLVRCLRLLHPRMRDVLDGCDVPNWRGHPAARITNVSVQDERVRIAAAAEAARQREMAEERRAFREAQASRTLRDVDAYLNRYGSSGQFRTEAEAIRRELDDQAFADALASNTVAGFERYLSTVQRGRHADRARQAIASMDDAAWAEAERARTVRSYSAYVQQFPDGRHRGAADAALREIERRSFQVARDAATPEAMGRYLSMYPSGRYANQARRSQELLVEVAQYDEQMLVQRDLERQARGRSRPHTVLGLASLAGAGALAYFAYNDYQAYEDFKLELSRLSEADPAYAGIEASQNDALTRTITYGAAGVAALVVSGYFGGKMKKHDAAAAEAAAAAQELGRQRERSLSELNRLSAMRLSFRPMVAPSGRVGFSARVTW
ncbi:MAG: hypothetical protein RJQ04_18730 [Longimicrobiales bacterium]